MYKIVIVEDEELIRKGLQYTFNWLDYDCVVVGDAKNGKEGIEAIMDLNPDIVITDIKMPILDGLEMLSKFKNDDFETIVITGYAEFDYAKKAIKENVSDFILKPIDHNELAKALEKIVKKIKNKNMLNTISKSVGSFSDISILDSEMYFKNTNYETWFIPKVLKYIEKNFSKKISVNDIADELEISSTYLNRKFKKETNYTFNSFLNKYRIQKSLEYIREEKLLIYEIANEVGFTEYKYFSRVFKKYLNHSPSDFMKLKIYKKD